MASSFKSRSNQLDDREVINLKFFLKQLANEYYDMDLLSGSITDSSKAEQAKAIAKSFRAKMRELDDKASAASTEGDKTIKDSIVDAFPQTSAQLNDFLVLLQDVPDEL